MERIDPSRIAMILLHAPAWARNGLSASERSQRERAADALAATIVERLREPLMDDDRDQLRLDV
ncbi:DUF6771 family protein [Flavisphingomonas formosensis]|uniref:DUF6771 family protein n=1 Tax=Flavisphingomonas formosensis TaxID=861534 RepID=UPI002FCD21FA